LGFLFLSDFSAQLWKRKTDCDGAAPWVLGRTIELVHGVFMIQLDPLQSNNVVFLSTVLGVSPLYYPFESIYTAGNSIYIGYNKTRLFFSN
uniref:Uncharacterized protein n=1 Tax=Aegilops tauschii subsp. strangulata TaxID=200361 RepID=A0A453N2T7_AEGTS